MKAYSVTQPCRFHALTRDLLESEEALYNLPLGLVLKHCESHPGDCEIDRSVFRMAILEEGGKVIGLVCQEPPRFVLPVFEENPTDLALQTLHDFLLEEGWEFPGLIGTVEHAERVMLAFARPYKRHVPHACYELRDLIPPRPCSGKVRLAQPSDADLVFAWLERFYKDVFADGEQDVTPQRSFVDSYIGKNYFYLWEDKGSQCMAAFTRPLPNGICIAYVYTPDASRGKGYASNLVAAMCELQLAEGREYIALFADGANLTSNKIYQALGFQHIGGSLLLSFL